MKKRWLLLWILFVAVSPMLFANDSDEQSVRVELKDSEKLDLILQKLEEMKSELEVIKVRASQR